MNAISLNSFCTSVLLRLGSPGPLRLCLQSKSLRSRPKLFLSRQDAIQWLKWRQHQVTRETHFKPSDNFTPQHITVCSLYLPLGVRLDVHDIIDVLKHLQTLFVLMGDFNAHNTLWRCQECTLVNLPFEWEVHRDLFGSDQFHVLVNPLFETTCEAH